MRIEKIRDGWKVLECQLCEDGLYSREFPLTRDTLIEYIKELETALTLARTALQEILPEK